MISLFACAKSIKIYDLNSFFANYSTIVLFLIHLFLLISNAYLLLCFWVSHYFSFTLFFSNNRCFYNVSLQYFLSRSSYDNIIYTVIFFMHIHNIYWVIRIYVNDIGVYYFFDNKIDIFIVDQSVLIHCSSY